METTSQSTDRREVLTDLYDRHERGDMSSDDEGWLEVQDLLERFVRREVMRAARGLFGEPLESAIVDVGGDILRKWLSKRFSPREGRDLEPLLRTAVQNRLRDYFRTSKHPSTVHFDGCEATWAGRADTGHDEDVFGMVRSRLPGFRFPEHGLVREAVLAHFLTHRRYPGASFLAHLGVGAGERVVVYNACVVDLNSAMLDVCGSRDAD